MNRRAGGRSTIAQSVIVHACAMTALACGGSTTPPTESCTVEGSIAAGGLTLGKPDHEPVGCKKIENPSHSPEHICEQKRADFACVSQTRATKPSVDVTLTGCLDIFGFEDSYRDLTVSIFRERLSDGTPVDPGYDVHGPRDQQNDRTPAARIARAKTREVSVTECPAGGAFSLERVPTETDLIVRVSHQNAEVDARYFVDTYQYNIRLRNDALKDGAGLSVSTPTRTCAQKTCFAERKVTTISTSTYKTMPRSAGVSAIAGESNLFDGVGQGHVAGEIQDCTSEHKIQNAVVAVGATARKLTYFNVGFSATEGNLDSPKPNPTRNKTNADGLYAAIGVDVPSPQAPIVVGAAITHSLCGTDGVCRCTSDGTTNPAWTAADAKEEESLLLGTRSIYVFPDSVTLLTFDRGIYEVSR